MNLYNKINQVMLEVKTVVKDGKISMAGQSYQVVTHDMVTSVLHEPCARIGIVLIPTINKHEISSFDKTDKYGNVKKEYMVSVLLELIAVNSDAPEERFSVFMPAFAFDQGDKATGKAISLATKAAYLKLFMLESIDEEEARPEAKYETRQPFKKETVQQSPPVDYKKKADQIETIKIALTERTMGKSAQEKQKFLTDNLKVSSFKDVEKMNNDELVNIYNKLSNILKV